MFSKFWEETFITSRRATLSKAPAIVNASKMIKEPSAKPSHTRRLGRNRIGSESRIVSADAGGFLIFRKLSRSSTRSERGRVALVEPVEYRMPGPASDE